MITQIWIRYLSFKCMSNFIKYLLFKLCLCNWLIFLICNRTNENRISTILYVLLKFITTKLNLVTSKLMKLIIPRDNDLVIYMYIATLRSCIHMIYIHTNSRITSIYIISYKMKSCWFLLLPPWSIVTIPQGQITYPPIFTCVPINHHNKTISSIHIYCSYLCLLPSIKVFVPLNSPRVFFYYSI
jgi:hypothetical protein